MTQIIVLLWLCLAGGGWGWQRPGPALLNMVAILALTAAAVHAVRHNRALLLNPVGWGLAAILLAQIMATVTHQAWQFGPVQVVIWAGYLSLFYARPWTETALASAAQIALLIYAPLSFVWPDNANIAASNVLALALLALPQNNFSNPKNCEVKFYRVMFSFRALLWLTVLGVMVYQRCIAGLLAALAAALVLYPIPHKRPLLALAAPVLVAGYWLSPHSYTLRLQFWTDALSAMPWGVGPGNYYLLNGWPHAHNFPLNLMAETGIFGLIALAFIALLIVTHRAVTVARPALAILAAFGLWSLLDNPWQVLMPGFVMVYALTKIHPSKEFAVTEN